MEKIDRATRRLELVHRLHRANARLRDFDTIRAQERGHLVDAKARAYRELAQFDTDSAMSAGFRELERRGELSDDMVRP